MDDLTFSERLYAEAELSFARHLHSLGGWRSNAEHMLSDIELQSVGGT